VCSFIGAQAMIDTDKHGGRNPLVELAAAIDIFGHKTDAERELDEMRGERVADRLEDDPRFAKVAADPAQGVEAANGPGSFEALASMFGSAVPGPESVN